MSAPVGWLARWFAALVGWLRSFVSPRSPSREVVRLPSHSASGRAADVVREAVRTEGVWREGQKRLALRDARLLPDPSRGPRWAVFGHKPRARVMPADEARRLFSDTLRTRDRDARTLAADVELLARRGLPVWRTEAELAAGLGVGVRELRHFSLHRARERVTHYVAFAIPKRAGGERVIHAPKPRLKALLRRVQAELVSKLPVHPAAHGFVRGRSVATNAAPHVGRAVVVKLDLRDFFPSLTFARVRGLWLALGYSYPVAATLAALVTEAERQPVEVEGELLHVPVGPRVCVQGAPTSPGIANALVRRLDARLAGLAKSLGWAYTRYADDLTFSGDEPARAGDVVRRATRIVNSEGFAVRGDKTRVMRASGAQRVAGVTVNEVLGLSRTERKKLRAELHREKTRGASDEQRARTTGKLAYLAMLNPEQAAALARRR